MKRRQKRVVLFFLLLVFGLPVFGQGLRSASPEEVGLSSERLKRLEVVLQQYVDEGKIAGVVTLIARKGKVAHLKAFGKFDLQSGARMPTDAIFRIASMSKAITSVAVMMLYEEGRLLLIDPVSKFIPEFKGGAVAISLPEGSVDSKKYTLSAREREITIRDLLTHTSGISYGSGPVEEEYKAANLHGWNFTKQSEPIGEAIKRLAKLPAVAQPGKKWVYGFGTDILGHVVERGSGKSLAEFLQQRIFDPLKMTDTHFYLPENKLARFTPVYAASENGALELAEEPALSSYYKGPRICYSGGAGLLSTASDYARFLQMLLNNGELDGVRLLSPKTVELMTVNHVGDLYGQRGFGLGFWVIEHLGRVGQLGSVGAYGWAGAYYTTYWVDPSEKLVALLMTQLRPSRSLDLEDKFRALVYQAVVR